ncbi:hypothetical protein WN944_006438 [Citrus x changshan-huyou]|uniref:Uncharacterized protein n=1 Tax=Citrus x changshan-huyou TaxID=2935761 RepID=A0AAP0MNY9_9ROSI
MTLTSKDVVITKPWIIKEVIVRKKRMICWVFNVQLGERLKLAWLGVEADPLLQSDDLLKKAYNRPSQDVNGSTQKSPKRLISKNAIVSELGLLGIKQGNVDSVEGEARASKVRRKRIVRKKVTA